MPVLNFFDTYTLMAVVEEIVPQQSFFLDRYFATGDDDIFQSDKVLMEYQKGDRRMAPFVSPRAGDIPMDRQGYHISELQPAFIAPSRILTADDLRKRGFGEALYPGATKAQRAAKLQLKDMTDMDRRIRRREEWMAAQTMINNACTMQEYVDDHTKGETLHVKFFDNASEHRYTANVKWTTWDIMKGDVMAMCRMLTTRGLPAEDLVLGSEASAQMLELPGIEDKLNKNSGINIGAINETLTKYDGVVFMGRLNFGGNILNVFSVDETYEDENGQTQRYFPETSAMVTAPGCGHMMYGQITQIDHGSTEFTDHAGTRVPKFILDQEHDVRKIRLGSRPLAAPKNYCPYIYAANVVEVE